jgi:hypothetical protein
MMTSGLHMPAPHLDPELTSTAKEVGQINALHINSGHCENLTDAYDSLAESRGDDEGSDRQ